MTEKETGFPYEASDSKKKGNFYAESLRPDKPPKDPGHLTDEAEVTGNPGEFGGGYGAQSLTPQDIDPDLESDWRLSDETKRIGREGVQKARDALNNQPQNEEGI